MNHENKDNKIEIYWCSHVMLLPLINIFILSMTEWQVKAALDIPCDNSDRVFIEDW